MGKHGKSRALDLWLAQEVEARILGLIDENTGIGADGIGDQNFAGPLAINRLDGRLPATGKQIALASLSQATQIG